MTTEYFVEASANLIKAFTPNRPIDLPEFLAGRKDLLYKAFDAAQTPGQHIILFGERGIGKTSIARVLAYNLQETQSQYGRRAILAQCSSSDDYSAIWVKISQEVMFKQRQLGFLQHELATITGGLSLSKPISNPNDARLFIQSLQNPTVIIIDEFDRIPTGNNLRQLMADTIKSFSDFNVDSTIIIVGVAESIAELISEHQ